jgi:hypothetical protein
MARTTSDVNVVDDDGASALLYALRYGQNGVVDVLLERGANPNVVDRTNRETPLLVACANGNIALVRRLLDRGASAAAIDQYGMNALDRAILMTPNPQLEALLRARGVKEAFGR